MPLGSDRPLADVRQLPLNWRQQRLGGRASAATRHSRLLSNPVVRKRRIVYSTRPISNYYDHLSDLERSTLMKDQYLKTLRGRANNLAATRVALSEIRSTSNPSRFPSLIKSLRRACPKFVSRHCVSGKPSFSDLGWDGHLEPLDLKEEVTFASLWLSPYAVQINSFRNEALVIQALVIDGELSRALERVNDCITAHGWSFWLAEMKYGLVQLVKGDSGRHAIN